MSDITIVAPPGGWAPPWPLLVEISLALPVGRWMLVGGLMVQLHARAAGVDEVRPTDDVDVLIDVMGTDVTVAVVAGRLRELDFEQDAWVLLPETLRQRGQDTLRILSA